MLSAGLPTTATLLWLSIFRRKTAWTPASGSTPLFAWWITYSRNGRVGPSAMHNAAIVRVAENGQLAVVERLMENARVDPDAGKDG